MRADGDLIELPRVWRRSRGELRGKASPPSGRFPLAAIATGWAVRSARAANPRGRYSDSAQQKADDRGRGAPARVETQAVGGRGRIIGPVRRRWRSSKRARYGSAVAGCGRRAAPPVRGSHNPHAVSVGGGVLRVVDTVLADCAAAVRKVHLLGPSVGREARVARPVVPGVRRVVKGEEAHTKSRLTERGPLWLRLEPRDVRALAVAAVAQIEIDGTTCVDAAVEDGPGALIDVDVTLGGLGLPSR